MVIFAKNEEDKKMAQDWLSNHDPEAEAAAVIKPISIGEPLLLAIPGAKVPTMMDTFNSIRKRKEVDRLKLYSLEEIRRHVYTKRMEGNFIIVFRDAEVIFGSNYVVFNAPYLAKCHPDGSIKYSYLGRYPENVQSVNGYEVKNLVGVYDLLMEPIY